ncbi:MAG: hypothetical protein QXH92_04455 [Candidatus Aenigmatarchaeota archaeon]
MQDQRYGKFDKKFIEQIIRSLSLCHVAIDANRANIKDAYSDLKVPPPDEWVTREDLSEKMSILNVNEAQAQILDEDVVNKINNKSYSLGEDISTVFNGLSMLIVSLFEPKTELAKDLIGKEIEIRLMVRKPCIKKAIISSIKNIANQWFNDDLTDQDFNDPNKINKLKFYRHLIPFYGVIKDYHNSIIAVSSQRNLLSNFHDSFGMYLFQHLPENYFNGKLENLRNLPTDVYSFPKSDDKEYTDAITKLAMNFLIKDEKAGSVYLLPKPVFENYLVLTTWVTVPIFGICNIGYKEEAENVNRIINDLSQSGLHVVSTLFRGVYLSLLYSFSLFDEMLRSAVICNDLMKSDKSENVCGTLSLKNSFQNCANFVTVRSFQYTKMAEADDHPKTLGTIVSQLLTTCDAYAISMTDFDAVNLCDWESGKEFFNLNPIYSELELSPEKIEKVNIFDFEIPDDSINPGLGDFGKYLGLKFLELARYCRPAIKMLGMFVGDLFSDDFTADDVFGCVVSPHGRVRYFNPHPTD